MKHTKNSKVSRDTFPVVRKGISLHASRETLLFQKMKKIQKPLKPKKGSKVLCVAEYPGWKKTARINPKIGWVYLVQDTKKVNTGTPDEDVQLILLGQGAQPDDRVWCYPSRYFQVVGKGRVIRPRF